MKSAIGEKLTRKDHGDVSNQLVRKALYIIIGHTLKRIVFTLMIVCEVRYW